MSTAETNSTPGQPAPKQQRQSIDLQKLADNVYRLMLADIRLERARGVYTTRRREIEP